VALSSKLQKQMKTPKKTPKNGYLLHRGKVNGETYSVIVTGTKRRSYNSKTGNMLQIWFLLDRVNPVECVLTGLDAKTICQECPFASGRGCYVNTGQAPLGIFRAHARNPYPELLPKDYPSVFSGRTVRFGAFGNPTLLPLSKVKAITAICAGWTGYFHNWKNHRFAKQYAEFFMASTETLDSFKLAQSLGYRTFHASPVQPSGTRECLNSTQDLTCHECRLCAGLSKGNQSGVWIKPHGTFERAASAIAMGLNVTA
jgi:hypothetical protein